MKKLLLGLTFFASMSSFAGVCTVQSISYDIENRFDQTLHFTANGYELETIGECVEYALSVVRKSQYYFEGVNSKTINYSYASEGIKVEGSLTNY